MKDLNRRSLRVWMIAFSAGAWVLSVQLAAQPKQDAAGPSLLSPNHSVPNKSARRSRHRSRALRARRRNSYHYRIARLHPQPERIMEIQRALVQAGYLHEDASGEWDGATRDAMLRFQQEHGFPATGLPEAKSLMKLGLGPHPLPEEADPGAAARPHADTPPQSAPTASADQPPDQQPANSGQPQKEQ